MKSFDHSLNKQNSMNKANGPVNQIKIALLIGLLVSMTGCSTYGGGPFYDKAIVKLKPNQYIRES